MKLVKVVLIFLLFGINNTLSLWEGDDCVTQNPAGPGKCVPITKCDHAKTLIKLNKIPQQCGFKKRVLLVCCPASLPELSSTKTKAQEKCEEYQNPRHQKTSVAHGQKALSKEFPHMAAIGYDDGHETINWWCGGSLISEQFVLTAAHCINSHGVPKWVRLGDLDLNQTTDNASPETIPINQTYLHPNYKRSSHYNDIALLKLQKVVNFGPYIKPACLQITNNLPKNQLQVIGWGKTDFLGETSPHLLKATLTVINHNQCSRNFANVRSRKLKNGILHNLQICAGDKNGSDTCLGDSGGPLHYLNDRNTNLARHHVVVGITSFGKGCGFENSVGVYTRVSSYISWIESVVWAK